MTAKNVKINIMSAKLPVFMQSCLWSYDISKIDPKKDQYLIITQALNYGTPQQLGWTLQNYTDAEIKEVVIRPARGMWWRDKLRFWLNKFGVMIDPLKFEAAIREINLRPVSLTAEFFRQVDVNQNTIARTYS